MGRVPNRRDFGIDRLLALDGETLVLTEDGAYWVKFVVRRVKVSPLRPHGLKYSLTLHGSDNERLVGFDNAHSVPPADTDDPHDHRHVLKSVKPYEYADSAALLEAFWGEVDKMLKQLGVTP
jgi:hypothetical protein